MRHRAIRRRLPRSSERDPQRLESFGRLIARSGRARAWAAPHDQPELLLGRCAMCAMLMAFLLASSSHGARAYAAAAAGIVAGLKTGEAWHRRSALALAERVRKEMPLMLDRLSMCVMSGMSVERALRTVAGRTSGPLADALNDGLRALDAGVPRARAYERIADRAGADEARALMHALARADRFGTSVAATLMAHAQEARSRARAAAEADARAAPVKLIFPLVFCFLPAFVLLTIAPIAISAVRTIGGL